MDDELLEKKLRDAYDPNPPEGMRERVLAKAMRELPTRPARPRIFTWRVALSVAGVLTIFVCNLLDNRWMDGGNQPPVNSLTYQALQSRSELARALGDFGDERQGGYFR